MHNVFTYFGSCFVFKLNGILIRIKLLFNQHESLIQI